MSSLTLLDHKYTREVYIKGYKKTNITFLLLSELVETDEYYKILSSKLDNVTYKFPESSRFIIFNTCETWNAVVQLETFYNLSTIRILFTDSIFTISEIIQQIKSYLVDTIKNTEINSSIANAIKFKVYLYLPNLVNDLVNFRKTKDSTNLNIFGINMLESLTEYIYEFNFDENLNPIEDYYVFNFVKEDKKVQNNFSTPSIPSQPQNPSPFQGNHLSYPSTFSSSSNGSFPNRIFG